MNDYHGVIAMRALPIWWPDLCNHDQQAFGKWTQSNRSGQAARLNDAHGR